LPVMTAGRASAYPDCQGRASQEMPPQTWVESPRDESEIDMSKLRAQVATCINSSFAAGNLDRAIENALSGRPTLHKGDFASCITSALVSGDVDKSVANCLSTRSSAAECASEKSDISDDGLEKRVERLSTDINVLESETEAGPGDPVAELTTKVANLAAEVEDLRMENEALRNENAILRSSGAAGSALHAVRAAQKDDS